MSRSFKFRLVAFILAIFLMVSLTVGSAHISWRRTGELQDRLTAVQLKSFQIANQFQQRIWELNNAVIRYSAYHDTNDWAHFETARRELDRWIDAERPNLRSEREKQILDQINTAYDDYIAATTPLEAKVKEQFVQPHNLAEFAEFEKQSQRILDLGIKLGGAHSESMDSFLAESKKALSYLRYLLLGSLTLLLLACGGLAVLVYDGLISPLRIKLVENQALMQRQEKLASLGLLAAGVAHEIRNPLTAIKAWLYIQRKNLQPATQEFADAEIISSEVSRLESIVQDVLVFARPSEPQFVQVPAVEPLHQVRSLLANPLEQKHIRLLVEEGAVAKLRIDRQQIQQVLINLIQNAADSIGQDGTITLRTRTGTQRLADSAAEVVILEVADTGQGMPQAVEKRLFDPFFTTKETGTGLGLVIAARIVEKHGGILQYQTQVGHGTTFGIVLPRA